MKAMADPAVGADKARAAFDLYRDVRAYEAEEAFVADFVALQAKLPVIRADRKIEIREKVAGERTGKVQQSTPYATFPGIMKVVQPLLTKHNFTLSFSTEPTATGTLLVKGILQHAHGHKRETAFPLPAETSGSKNNVQGWGSSQSYGKRYCTVALLNIVSHAIEDDDTDGHQGNFKPNAQGTVTDVSEPEKVSEDQAAQLRKKIGDCKVPMDKVRQTYNITNIDELPANQFAAVIKSCDNYAASLKARANG